MSFDAFHLPPDCDTSDYIELQRADTLARAPRLQPQDVRRVCAALRAARERVTRVPVARIIDAIDAAARSIRDPHSASYSDLIGGITAFTGFSPPMAMHVLERMSGDWLRTPLERLLDTELGGARAVDDFITRPDGTKARAVAPPLTLHIFSGNVPGVNVMSIVRALLVKSAVLGKTAAGEPLLAPHFARALATIDPLVGACVAVTYWSGGDEQLEATALECTDTVIHYGGAAAIQSLRSRAPSGTRVIEHGPRLSFAIVAAGIVNGPASAQAAADLARSVALFDQQGCVSPQLVYVLGGESALAAAFAAQVASALRDVQRELPRGRLDTAEAAAIRQLRTRAEFRSIRGEPVTTWTDDALAWTVILEPDPEFRGTCLNRTLLVKHAPSLDVILDAIRPLDTLLQTVGVAGFGSEQLHELARALADTGATRITSLDAMPWPPLTWHHDGRGPLTEIIRWADLEP